MRRAARVLVALLVVFGLFAGADVLVKAANGDYAGDYALTGYFPRAGEGLQSGSQVVFRGVQVGRVAGIALAGTSAKVTVLIEPRFKVPRATTATIEPVNLFGAEQVSLTSPRGNADTGPWLAAGATFTHAASSDELGDLFAAAVPLLNSINTVDLSTVISNLSQASDGEGPGIARSLDEGTRLAGLLDNTLDAQLLALDSFSRFTQATADDGPAINGLSTAENQALPAFNRDAADYQRLLDSLTPFSQQVAAILTDYHPDLAAILADGDNVARVLTAQQGDLGQVVRGAYQYLLRFANGESPTVLPDGSHFAYFNTFILFSDVNSLVCSLIAPDQANLSFLEPLQQAIAGSGSALNCSSQLAAFNAAQATDPPGSTAPATSTRATAPATSAAQQLATAAYQAVGQAQNPTPTTIGGYILGLLGGGG